MTFFLLLFLFIPGDVSGLDTLAYEFPSQDACLHAVARNFIEDDPAVMKWLCVTETEYKRLWKERTGHEAP